MPFSVPVSLDAAVARLVEGNRRFVEERPQAPVASAMRIELANAQFPFAVVLGCSDSRVPIEAIFDQHPGNLFVVRSAGPTVNDDGLASVEYGVEILHCMLVVVLGHSSCGAIQAAMSLVDSGATFPGHIQQLTEKLAPAVRAARTASGDWWANAVAANVRETAGALTARSTILDDAVARGFLRVAGAVYDLRTGAVSFLD